MPRNWDASQADEWYAYFNAETAGTEGVSSGDLMSGTMKYTETIRTYIGM